MPLVLPPSRRVLPILFTWRLAAACGRLIPAAYGRITAASVRLIAAAYGRLNTAASGRLIAAAYGRFLTAALGRFTAIASGRLIAASAGQVTVFPSRWIFLLILGWWTFGTSDALGAGRVAQAASDTTEVDREFVLESTILGYHGIGGDIDGVRNPVLQALRGEIVRVTIVNGELLVHDIALERNGAKSEEVLEVGERAYITFRAEEDDTYYCSIPGHRAAGMEGRFAVFDDVIAAPEGEPVRRNGRVLNLDLESGTLADWAGAGDAFAEQPASRAGVQGEHAPEQDEVGAARHEPSAANPGDAAARQGDTPAGQGDTPGQHGESPVGEGRFWIDSAVPGGVAATGHLTSDWFTVIHPFASFRLAGGAFAETRIEIVRAADDRVVFRASGYDGHRMRTVVADLTDVLGQEVFIRLLDNETGEPSNPFHATNPYAYIAFDHFRFHPQRPSFPDELSADDAEPLPPLEVVEFAGLSGPEAVDAMRVPEGFSVMLAASEPDVVRPIGFALDDRGRLWVAEGHTYPQRAPDGEGRDRILIFEDTNGDGRLDSRRVFTEGLNLVSGIEVGFGGVWIGAAPYLMFIPIDKSGDRPAGEPEILLDGWGYHDTHETLNTLRWGPDGWLYGTQGVFTESLVGRPGTPPTERIPMNGGVWRFHPTRHEFEVFAHGTSNPWGLDWNEYGHAFITVCVIPHLFHVIQGARYHRQDGEHFNPHTFDDIRTIADHVHWVGDKGWAAGSRRGGGGGHAHAGAMIYQGGSWPAEYRSRVMMNNIHGYRVNADILEPSGSGYTASHGPDFLLANDSWSQLLNFRYGPDGSVHVIDWYDKNQCHSTNPDVHDKTLGRIFKISHENDRPVRVDLAETRSAELVALQRHENEWYVRHARRMLQERGPDTRVHEALRQMLQSSSDTVIQLRALWSLHVTEGLSEPDLLALLRHDDEFVRAWAIQLIAEDRLVDDETLAAFADLAREDASPVVRLYLASALQRLGADARGEFGGASGSGGVKGAEPQGIWEVLTELHAHGEDANDHNLPLMVWYATEQLVPADLERALDLALTSRLPRMLEFTVQRIAAVGTQEALRVLSRRLPRTERMEQKQMILDGINVLVQRNRGSSETAADSASLHIFERVRLSSDFLAEGAAIGDLDGDGAADVIAGPYWYRGPDFDERHEIYPPRTFDPLQYSDNFIVHIFDFDDDGWNDVLVVGFPGREAFWYANPGGGAGEWERHLVFDGVDNESPYVGDITGNGRPDLVFHHDGYVGYAAYDPERPTEPWSFRSVSEQGDRGPFTHGLGVGDVDGDAHPDIIMSSGWWRNPGPSSDAARSESWKHHPFDFGDRGAQMYAYDVDGDGLNDVITSLDAHGWGLAWFRQVRRDGEIDFDRQLIMGEKHADNPYGVRFSQPHAVGLVDVDGDGLKDIITGKRFWAHGPDGDPEPNAPAVLYWFRLVRPDGGSPAYIPHLIDDDSGVGVFLAAGDLTGDGHPDLAISNKKGTFVFRQQVREVPLSEWRSAQPQPVSGPD